MFGINLLRYLACVHLWPDGLVLQGLDAVSHLDVVFVHLSDFLAHGNDEFVSGYVTEMNKGI